MSELLIFRLAVTRSSTDRLWEQKFNDALSHLNLRMNDISTPETAITNLDGNSLIWFDSRSDAWRWLQMHDGFISLWTDEETHLGISIRHVAIGYRPNGVPQSEIDISVDLPSKASEAIRERIVSTADSLAAVILDECDVVRGLAYDEEMYERVDGATPRHETSLMSEIPGWLGYWNAVPLECLNDQLKATLELAGGEVEQRKSSVVIRLAKWPWKPLVADGRELATSLPC